ncbi:MAG: hypothetical protein WD016_09150 [Balneolaceae bacterium]
MIRALLFFISLSIILTGSDNPPSTDYSNTINPVIGDISYIQKFGHAPDENTSEITRIKTHLEYVVVQLKNEAVGHLNADQKQNRAHLISLLEGYKDAEQFPKNHHFENRQPVFIDEEGNLCAVGYLIAQTEGKAVAESINKTHKFDYIKDIDAEVLTDWLTKNGLSKTEAAMIQPMYGDIKSTVNENNIETSYAIGSSLLAGMQMGSISYSLLAQDSNSDIRKISILNTALGVASVTLGITNIDNSYTVRSPECTEICIGISYETTYTNQARTNLSISNIVVGGASALFNGVRFFTTQKSAPGSRYNLSATQLYDPASKTISPGLSFNLRF